MAYTLDNKIVV